MKDQKDENCSHGFDASPVDERPFVPVESKISIRDNWILMFILLNVMSISTLIFLGTGGRPIDAFKRIVGLVEPVESSKPTGAQIPLLNYREMDYDSVKKAVEKMYGVGTKFQLIEHSENGMAEMKKAYAAVGRMRGKTFIKIDENLFYLSDDEKRLYSCIIPGQTRSRRATVEKSKPRVVHKTEKSATAEEMYQDQDGMWQNRAVDVPREEFYQDKDGVWRNNVIYASPPAAKKDDFLKEKQDKAKMRQAEIDLRRAQELRRQHDRNRPMGDLSSFERFDPSEYKED